MQVKTHITTVNLTQHSATPEQVAAGVVDLPEADRRLLIARLTFNEVPTHEDIHRRCHDIADMAQERGVEVMIGGAPWMMAPLERTLISRGLAPCYAFYKRETSVFRHAGFIWV